MALTGLFAAPKIGQVAALSAKLRGCQLPAAQSLGEIHADQPSPGSHRETWRDADSFAEPARVSHLRIPAKIRPVAAHADSDDWSEFQTPREYLTRVRASCR
jgi:hypothetical protein